MMRLSFAHKLEKANKNTSIKALNFITYPFLKSGNDIAAIFFKYKFLNFF